MALVLTLLLHCAGTENTLGPSTSKGGEHAASKAETTAGSSATQQLIEKPHEVISFEAAKEVHTCLAFLCLAFGFVLLPLALVLCLSCSAQSPILETCNAAPHCDRNTMRSSP